jgi:hypothetical protein
MSESQRRRRRQHEEGRFRRFLRTYRFEIVWLIVVALGIFLILERMNIRARLLQWLRAAAASLFHGAGHLEKSIAAFLARTTFSDAVGYVLILAALAAIVWRIRWRMMHSPALTTLRCPRCSGDIHRVHRHLLDRLISLYVPVRRYRCTNGKCRWHGLRVGSSHSPPHMTAAGRQPQAGS